MANDGEQDTRQQIHDALLSYCRGIDRLDPEALRQAFHPGASLIDFGPDPMTIETFAEHALASLGERFSATQHRISNTAISFDGDAAAGSAAASALVETYVLAYHLEQPATLHTFNGRYIDRFENRDGQWRISTRTLRNDWSKVEIIDQPMRGSWQASGRGGSPDPLYDTSES